MIDKTNTRKQPKILIYDIETVHHIAAVWGLFKQNIPHQSLLEPGNIVCASYMWLGDKKATNLSVADYQHGNKKVVDIRDDKALVQEISRLITEADAIVTHNGDRFDTPWVRTRLIHHGLPPIPKPMSIDTYKVVRNLFRFPSNRLDYLGQYLGVGGKMDTPGGLWYKVLEGDRAALNKMSEYCGRDVELLKDVYLKLRPHMHNHPNANVFTGETHSCPVCGSFHLQRKGVYPTNTGSYHRYQCMDCGKFSRGKQRQHGTDIR